MEKKHILLDEGVPLYHGVIYNAKYTMEVSGQVGINLETIEMVEGGIREQTIKVFDNIEYILSQNDWTLENVVKVRIYITDLNNASIVNEEYKKRFKKDYPTRLMIGVKELPINALVEIECVAVGDTIKE